MPVEARPVSSKGKKGGKKDAPAAGKAATPPEAQEAQEAGPPKDLTQDVERVCKVSCRARGCRGGVEPARKDAPAVLFS